MGFLFRRLQEKVENNSVKSDNESEDMNAIDPMPSAAVTINNIHTFLKLIFSRTFITELKKIDNDNIMDNNYKYPLKFLLRRFISSTIALSIALEKVHMQGYF